MVVHRHKRSPSLCRQVLMLGVMNNEEGTCAAGISPINKTSAWLLLWHIVLGIGRMGLIETIPLACFLFFCLPACFYSSLSWHIITVLYFCPYCREPNTTIFPLVTVSGPCFLLPPGVFFSLTLFFPTVCALALTLSAFQSILKSKFISPPV